MVVRMDGRTDGWIVLCVYTIDVFLLRNANRTTSKNICRQLFDQYLLFDVCAF